MNKIKWFFTEVIKIYSNYMNKIKWFFTEVIKIYSTESSYFSKKRIESGVSFIIAQWGMITYLTASLSHSTKFGMTDMLIWAGIEFGICGYMINKIERGKNDTTTKD